MGGAREGRDRECETECEQGSGEGHPWNLFTSGALEESQKFERMAFARHHALADNSQRKRSSREARHAALETPACRNGGPCGHRARGRYRRPRHGRHIRRREPGRDPAATGPGRAHLRLVQPLRAVQSLQPVRGGMRAVRTMRPLQSVRWGLRRLWAVQPMQPVQPMCGHLRSLWRVQPLQSLCGRMRSVRRVQPVRPLQPVQSLRRRLRPLRCLQSVRGRRCGRLRLRRSAPRGRLQSL